MDAIRSTLHHVASSSSDPDPFEPSTSESLRQIAFAGWWQPCHVLHNLYFITAPGCMRA